MKALLQTAHSKAPGRLGTVTTQVEIPAPGIILPGELNEPASGQGLVIFAHGSGSGRHSPRNRWVAQELARAGFNTLLFDLLTRDEDQLETRFDIDLLSERLKAAWEWARPREERIGFFGASTGAAAAIRVAAELVDQVAAVVSRGGRPDLVLEWLPRLKSPLLLLVGGEDPAVLAYNQAAYRKVNFPKELYIVPGATHLFSEPGALEVVAQQAKTWFSLYLAGQS